MTALPSTRGPHAPSRRPSRTRRRRRGRPPRRARAPRALPARDRRLRRRAGPARARAHDRLRLPAHRPARHATLPDDWDAIPGARGCTAEACAFRDHHADLLAAGASAVYGLSTQDTAYQREAVDRLHLPFPMLSDEAFALTRAMDLPTFEAAGRTLLRRLTMVVRDGVVEKVFYPVFPPDRHAAEVLAWLTHAVRPTSSSYLRTDPSGGRLATGGVWKPRPFRTSTSSGPSEGATRPRSPRSSTAMPAGSPSGSADARPMPSSSPTHAGHVRRRLAFRCAVSRRRRRVASLWASRWRLISRLRVRRAPLPIGAAVIEAGTPVAPSAEDELLVRLEHGDVGTALRSLSPSCAPSSRRPCSTASTSRVERLRLLDLPGTVESRSRAARRQLRHHLVARPDPGADVTTSAWRAAPTCSRGTPGEAQRHRPAAVKARLDACAPCREHARSRRRHCSTGHPLGVESDRGTRGRRCCDGS